MSVITVSDAVKEYQSGSKTLRALTGVDLSVRAGEFVAIVGPSGSGKSTLLNLLGLLDEPTEGTVTVDGERVSALSTRQRTDLRRRTIGFVFQHFYLVPTLTARDNVAIPGLVRSERGDLPQRAADLLQRVGLGDRTDHYPNELSGGQKQRVAFARSLINDPDVLLADEPTGNLDQDTSHKVLDVFERITSEDVAVIAVTHDQQVASYADRTVELVNGGLQ